MSNTTPLMTNPIAQTMLLPLCAKALHNQTQSAILNDSWALAIYQTLDEHTKQPIDKINQVSTALRAAYFDKQVKAFIDKHKDVVVVNVGCGLDARAHRLGEAAQKAVFYQVDIEEAIALRQALLPPKANEVLMVGSILDEAWLDTLKSSHPTASFIFVIEGVLMYFGEADNKNFLRALAECFLGACITFDICSTLMAKNSGKHTAIKLVEARFKSGIDDPKILESWHDRLKLEKVQSFGAFKENKQVGHLYYLAMRFLPFLHHSFKILTYRVV